MCNENSYQAQNQVKYQGEIAVINNNSSPYSVSFLQNNCTETMDGVYPNDLEQIKITQDVLLKCGPNKCNGLSLTWSFEEDSKKVEIWTGNNHCIITVNGNDVYKGVVSYLHELQNLVREHTGHLIWMS
jgi:hypothetical protein